MRNTTMSISTAVLSEEELHRPIEQVLLEADEGAPQTPQTQV